MIRCRLFGHEWALTGWRPTSYGAVSWMWEHQCQRKRCLAQLRTQAESPASAAAMQSAALSDECGQPFPCAHRAYNPDCNHPMVAS